MKNKLLHLLLKTMGNDKVGKSTTSYTKNKSSRNAYIKNKIAKRRLRNKTAYKSRRINSKKK